MDPLEIEYEKTEDIPEAFRPLYTEQNGKMVLNGINGMKTQGDVDRLNESLRKERNDHKAVKDKLGQWDFGEEMTPDKVKAQLDRIPELEAAAEGKIDQNKMDELVNQRLKQHTSPLERQIEGLAKERDTYLQERDDLKTQIEKRDRNDAVRSVAQEMKVHSTAIPDIEMTASMMMERADDGQFITKDGIPGVTPGLDIKSFMKEMMRSRPHWWPESEGGGANGPGGRGTGGQSNPWTKDNWNVTEQGRVYREQGSEQAAALAKAAGTKLGGPKPS